MYDHDERACFLLSPSLAPDSDLYTSWPIYTNTYMRRKVLWANTGTLKGVAALDEAQLGGEASSIEVQGGRVMDEHTEGGALRGTSDGQIHALRGTSDGQIHAVGQRGESSSDHSGMDLDRWYYQADLVADSGGSLEVKSGPVGRALRAAAPSPSLAANQISYATVLSSVGSGLAASLTYSLYLKPTAGGASSEEVNYHVLDGVAMTSSTATVDEIEYTGVMTVHTPRCLAACDEHVLCDVVHMSSTKCTMMRIDPEFSLDSFAVHVLDKVYVKKLSGRWVVGAQQLDSLWLRDVRIKAGCTDKGGGYG